MEDIYKYNTIANTPTSEFKDRGSKFLGYAYTVENTDEVKEHLKALKKEHPKAVHHCYAYRIGTEGNLYRANDDGEPSGSAGRPILGQIDSAELTNVLVVVVRYFGGSLLGVPGLINAYKTATTDALSQAEVVEKWIEVKVEIIFNYPEMGDVMHILKQADATIYKQDLQLFCNIHAGLPKAYAEEYLQKLSELQNVTVKTK